MDDFADGEMAWLNDLGVESRVGIRHQCERHDSPGSGKPCFTPTWKPIDVSLELEATARLERDSFEPLWAQEQH